jgi:hypothetical protein
MNAAETRHRITRPAREDFPGSIVGPWPRPTILERAEPVGPALIFIAPSGSLESTQNAISSEVMVL